MGYPLFVSTSLVIFCEIVSVRRGVLDGVFHGLLPRVRGGVDMHARARLQPRRRRRGRRGRQGHLRRVAAG